MKRRIVVAVLLVVPIILIMIVTTQCTDKSKPSTNDASSYVVGIWNNAEFSKPASEWTNAAKKYSSENGLIDLVVAQAQEDGFISLKFPYKSRGVLYSATSTDLVEKYLSKFESEGVKVILSIQPLSADINQIIGIVLSRYSNHKNIIGINLDIEWKESGIPHHVSNEERDIWLKEIKKYNNNYKLFITYFEDHTHFPDDHPDIVILYDGEADTQTNLLSQYQGLAKHYSATGIYTGYLSSTPPAASVEKIINAVPNTKYIIHTYDVFSERKLVIFQMDDVQVDWLESLSIDLMNLHIEKKVPVLCSVIPNNLNNPDIRGGYLPISILRKDFFKNVGDNYSDLVEIGQHGYTHNASETLQGMNYEEQKEIIEKGLQILVSLGIKPSTFVPPFGSADNTTVKVTKDLGFQNIIDIHSGLSSHEMLVLNDYVSLTSREGNNLTIKTPEQIMREIDQKGASGCVIVLYQNHDFQRESENKLIEFANVLDVLKNNGKYVFITPRQYKEYFAK